MGRGRKGLIEQSERRTKASGGLRGRRGEPMVHLLVPKREVKKILIKEDILEFMKNMNQQQLVDFLLSNDDWHVKTSGISASGI